MPANCLAMRIGEGQVLHIQQHFAPSAEKVATHHDPTNSLPIVLRKKKVLLEGEVITEPRVEKEME